jgi:hypothetical protein
MSITFDPYNCCSVFTAGSLTTTIESITATNLVIGGVPMTIFRGTADFTAPGFDCTMGTFGFSTQGNGPVTSSATGAVNSPVPELVRAHPVGKRSSGSRRNSQEEVRCVKENGKTLVFLLANLQTNGVRPLQSGLAPFLHRTCYKATFHDEHRSSQGQMMGSDELQRSRASSLSLQST